MKPGGSTSTTKTIPCVGCGELFPGRQRDDGRQIKYCSSRCRQKAKGILKECQQCGREFVSYYKYDHCSRDCYNKGRTLQVVTHQCGVCGEDIVRARSSDQRKDADPLRKRFCSRRCQKVGMSGEDSPLFTGTRKAGRGKTWSAQRAKQTSRRCRFCRVSVEGKGRHVDHIVPYRIAKRSLKDPNGQKNLWVLCRLCHFRKTKVEAVLDKFGVPRYECAVQEVAGKTPILNAIRIAFKYLAL